MVSVTLKLLLAYNVAIKIYVIEQEQKLVIGGGRGGMRVWPILNFWGFNSISSGGLRYLHSHKDNAY